jgi:hypothetical protein
MAGRPGKLVLIMITGGIYAVVVAPILGAVTMGSFALVDGKLQIGEALRVALVTVPIVLVIVSPVAFLGGLLGGAYVYVRRRRSRRALLGEAAIVGGLFGSTFPFLASALGWSPFSALFAVLGTIIGIIVATTYVIISYRSIHRSHESVQLS